MAQLPLIGERIYYTGDMANVPGWCTVTDHHPRTQWRPECVTLTNDDGRVHAKLPAPCFTVSPGQRFKPEQQYHTEHAAAVASVMAAAERYRASRA